MPALEPQSIIDALGRQIASAAIREAMQEAYAEQLEKQIASLQEQIREGSLNGVAKKRSEEATRPTNGAKATL